METVIDEEDEEPTPSSVAIDNVPLLKTVNKTTQVTFGRLDKLNVCFNERKGGGTRKEAAPPPFRVIFAGIKILCYFCLLGTAVFCPFRVGNPAWESFTCEGIIPTRSC